MDFLLDFCLGIIIVGGAIAIILFNIVLFRLLLVMGKFAGIVEDMSNKYKVVSGVMMLPFQGIIKLLNKFLD